MISDLYIDGKNIFEEFGMFVIDGGLKSLIAYPPSKSPEYYEWEEEDGIEADLLEPLRLDNRNVTIQFACKKFYNKYIEFIEFLSEKQEHSFIFPYLSRTFKLRLNTQPQSLSYVNDLGVVTLNCQDNYPTSNLPLNEYILKSELFKDCDSEIDNIPVGELGFQILDGVMVDTLKHASVRQPLSFNGKNIDGQIIDNGAPVIFKNRNLKLRFLLRTPLSTFWNIYDNLLWMLIKPNERVIDNAFIGDVFKGFYQSCVINNYAFDDKEGYIDFTINFCNSSSIRVTTDWLLASEDGKWIVLEDNPEEFKKGYIFLGKND